MNSCDPYNPQLELFENLQTSQYAVRILTAQGPTLDELNIKYQTKAAITSLTCAYFINQIDSLPGKQIKFTGEGKEALLNAFSYILLAIGCKQIKYYPHLISIIKEQFFKPGVFTEYEVPKRNRILNIIRNIEIQLISSGSVSEFLAINEEFLEGFQHVLNKILESSEEAKTYEEIIQIIRKRFNIDSGKSQVPNSYAKCWILGMQKRIYLFEEKQYFIVVSASTSTEPTRYMNESAIENRIQSEKSVSEGGQQLVVQASEESTPKFKQNQESIRYRKKSHKNSFGGDFQITGYNELASLVNRSQHEAPIQKKEESSKKLFSLKFQMQEMGCLTMEEDHNGKEIQNKGQSGKNLPMRGSNIEGDQGRRQKRSQRKKHITSSEIFNLINRNKDKGLSSKPQKLQQQENSNPNGNNNSKNSRTSIKKQIQNIIQQTNGSENEAQNTNQSLESKKFMKMDENDIDYVALQSLGLLTPEAAGGQKEFKFSFSKKDAGRFIFKEIESQYNDNDNDHDIELDTQAEIDREIRNGGIKASQLSLNNNQPLRSSLTQPKSNQNSAGLLSEGEYFKKKQKIRRSLLLQTNISPIQEEVQSSQREQTQEQSVSKSQKEIQNFQHPQQLEKKSNTSYNNKIFGQNNPNNAWASINSINNKNYVNIFKNKDRKFSYLTQPISTSKNSLFNGNAQEMRQSFMEEGNQTIPESPENTQAHHPSFFLKNKSKNRGSKSPKKIHKNSEAVTESKPKKRRFEENPISFSQMINIKDDSNFSANLQLLHKKPTRLSINKKVLSFTKDNVMLYNEPEGWIRKQVIYYFNNNQSHQIRRKHDIYIIDRAPPTQQPPVLVTQANALQAQPNIPTSVHENSHQNYTEPNNNNMHQGASHYHKQTSIAMSIENKPNSLSHIPLNHQNSNTQANLSYNSTNPQIKVTHVNKNLLSVQTIDHPSNKIRSTIDTTKTPPEMKNVNITQLSFGTNLLSETNPQEKPEKQQKQEKSINKSIKESIGKERNNQKVITQTKQKVKPHKHYRDLQNIHLNLRKNRSGGESLLKKRDSMSPQKHSQRKEPALNISYPTTLLLHKTNSLQQPSSPITATTATPTSNPLLVIMPSLSLTELRNLSKEALQKLQKERNLREKAQKVEKSKERSHHMVYSPTHISSGHTFPHQTQHNSRIKNMSFSPSKNLTHHIQNKDYNAFTQPSLTHRYTQFTPAQLNIHHINNPFLTIHTPPSHPYLNRSLSPNQQSVKSGKHEPNTVNCYNYNKYHVGPFTINSMPVISSPGPTQPLPGYMSAVKIQREGIFGGYKNI